MCNIYMQYFHFLQHELKKETHHTSKARKYDFKSTGPDDERFYVSLPTQTYEKQELEDYEKRGKSNYVKDLKVVLIFRER